MPAKTETQPKQASNKRMLVAACILLIAGLVSGTYYMLTLPPPPKPKFDEKVQPLIIPKRVNGQVQYEKYIVTLVVNDQKVVTTIGHEGPRLIDAWTTVVYERFNRGDRLPDIPLKEALRKKAEPIIGGTVEEVRLAVIRNLWPR